MGKSVEELKQDLAEAEERRENAFREKARDLALDVLDGECEFRKDEYNQEMLYGPWEALSTRQRAQAMNIFVGKAKNRIRWELIDAVRDVLEGESE